MTTGTETLIGGYENRNLISAKNSRTILLTSMSFGELAAMPCACFRPLACAICKARNMWKSLVTIPTEAFSYRMSFLLLTMFSIVDSDLDSWMMRFSAIPCFCR